MVIISNTTPDTFPTTDVLFQTQLWGKLKTITGQQAFYFWITYQKDEHDDKKFYFPLLVLIRNTKNNMLYAYIQRAPTITLPEEDRALFLEELSIALKEHLPNNTICIRYDLPWLSKSNSHESLRPELMEVKMNFATNLHNFKKSVTNHLCQDTIIINLSLPPEQLLQNMRQQTRNSVRRSYKTNIEFSIFNSESPTLKTVLKEWHDIYVETGKRKGFYYEEYQYFENLFTTKISTKDLVKSTSLVPMIAPVPQPRFYLFTANKEQILLSGLILAISGRTAYYMYAASTLENRECMPNYGLQWEVIRFARSCGCTKYDLMGIPQNGDSSNPMSGLYIFKTGFGGQQVRYGGAWDFPLNQDEYENLRLNEMLALRN